MDENLKLVQYALSQLTTQEEMEICLAVCIIWQFKTQKVLHVMERKFQPGQKFGNALIVNLVLLLLEAGL